MIKKILFSLMLAFVFACFSLMSFWLNLSSRALTPWLEFQVNSRLPANAKIEIGRVDTRIWGLRTGEIKLTDIEEKREFLLVDSLEISFNVFSLIFRQSLPLKIEIYEGEINGALKAEGLLELSPRFHVAFSGESIEPNRNPVLRKTELIISNPVLDINKARIDLSSPLSADFTLEFKDLKIGGALEAFKIPFELPETGFKSFKADLSLRDKKIQTSFKSSGDISGKLRGTVLRNPGNFKNSNLDLVLRISMRKEYWNSLDFYKDLIKKYLNKSKQIHMKIRGSFKRPKFHKI